MSGISGMSERTQGPVGASFLAGLLLAASCAAPPPAPAGEVLGQLVIDGVPRIPSELVERLEAYQNTRSALFLGWLEDGILISTRFGNTAQLHRVKEPLGMRGQVTFSEEPVAAAAVSPDPDAGGFLYVKDVGGSEFYQFFWLDLATRESTLLTDGRSRYSDIAWAASGRRFAYTTTERNGVDWDIHYREVGSDPADGDVAVALEGRGVGWTAEDWSPDETRMLVRRYVSINESYLHEVDLESGATRRLLEDVGRASIVAARYEADGERVLFTSDLGGEFVGLHRLDLATGALATLTAGIRWNVEEFAVSRDRRRLAFTVNEAGIGRPHVFELPGLEPLPLPELPDGIVHALAFAPSGDALGFVVNHAAAPGDVYSVDLEARRLTRWTQSELGGLDGDDLVAAELVHYESFDDREIPAFVFRPRGPGPHPVLVSIHGGPEGQFRPAFSYSTQFYVNELGIAVVAPNVRGSSGYGRTWLSLDNGTLREDSVRDIGALLDWIAARPELDAERVAVSGGSYGGYMVLASMVHFGERLTAGVERVGISNFVTFLTNTQDYRRDLRRAEYGDERDPEMRAFLEGISPLNHVDRMTRPILISQGLNDPRVPASESEQIVAALRARDVPVWYVLARDEGHGFRKKFNRDYQLAATALFLTRYLVDRR